MSFVLGVNYWPRKKAMYWWKDFERAEVENEFAEIAALKLQVVRIFLFWEDFQTGPEQINDQALADLGVVLDTAQALGLQVMPTFFTGHMSGANWWPEWALLDEEVEFHNRRCLSNGVETRRVGRDPYADPFMLAAECLLVAAVCGRYGEHPAVYSWNFANEPDIFYTPKSFEDSANWHAILTREVRKYSSRPISAGIHQPAVANNVGFRPDYLAPHCNFLSMHGYSLYYSQTRYTDPLNSDVVPFTNLITESLGGKPVLFEEFGCVSSARGDISYFKPIDTFPAMMRPVPGVIQYFADDKAIGRYYSEVLEKLALCGSLGAFGWMFSDYDPCVWSKPPLDLDTYEHERFFGLTRTDGTVKPSGEAMRRFAERVAAGAIPQRAIAPLKLNADEWYKNPQENYDRLFAQWKGQIKETRVMARTR